MEDAQNGVPWMWDYPCVCAQILLSLEGKGRRRRAGSKVIIFHVVKAHGAPLILEASFLFKGPY